MSDFQNPYIRKPAIRWVAGTPLPDMGGEGVAAPLLVDATTGALLVSGGGGGGGSTDMTVTNGILTTTAADTALIKENTAKVAGYSIPSFDYKAFTYSGTNISTITFKTGGSSGATVATLTFGYTSGNLTSITKS